MKLLIEIEGNLKEVFQEKCKINGKTMVNVIRDNMEKYVYGSKQADDELRKRYLEALKGNVEEAGKMIGKNEVTENLNFESVRTKLVNSYRLIEKIESL